MFRLPFKASGTSRKASFNETVWLLGSFMLAFVVILAVMGFTNSQKKVMEKGIASFSQFGGATVLKTPEDLVSAIQCSYTKCVYTGSQYALSPIAKLSDSCNTFMINKLVSAKPECDCKGFLGSVLGTFHGCTKITRYKYAGTEPVDFYYTDGVNTVKFGSPSSGVQRDIKLPGTPDLPSYRDFDYMCQTDAPTADDAYSKISIDWRTLIFYGLKGEEIILDPSNREILRKARIYPGAEFEISTQAGSVLNKVGTLLRHQTKHGDSPDCNIPDVGSEAQPIPVKYGDQCILKMAEKCLSAGKEKNAPFTCYFIRTENDEPAEYPLFFKDLLLTLGGDGAAPYVWDATKEFPWGKPEKCGKIGDSSFSGCYWFRDWNSVIIKESSAKTVIGNFDEKYASMKIDPSQKKGVQMEYVKIGNVKGVLLHYYSYA